MNFAAADISAMLTAFGDTALLGMTVFLDGQGDFDAVTTLDQAGTTGGVEYGCLFEAPAKVPNYFSGQIETSAPLLLMSAADAATAGVQHGTPLVVNSVDLWYVVGVEPDGSGMVSLALSSEAP